MTVQITDDDRDIAAQALWPLTRYRWPRTDELNTEQAEQWERVARALAEARAAGYAAGVESCEGAADDAHATGYVEGRRALFDEIMAPGTGTVQP